MRMLGLGVVILFIGLVGWLIIPGVVLYGLHLTSEQISSYGPILALSQLLVLAGIVIVVIGLIARSRGKRGSVGTGSKSD